MRETSGRGRMCVRESECAREGNGRVSVCARKGSERERGCVCKGE